MGDIISGIGDMVGGFFDAVGQANPISNVANVFSDAFDLPPALVNVAAHIAAPYALDGMAGLAAESNPYSSIWESSPTPEPVAWNGDPFRGSFIGQTPPSGELIGYDFYNNPIYNTPIAPQVAGGSIVTSYPVTGGGLFSDMPNLSTLGKLAIGGQAIGTIGTVVAGSNAAEATEAAARTTAESTARAQEIQNGMFQQELAFRAEESKKAQELSRQLQQEAIAADNAKLDRMLGYLNRAYEMELPFQQAAQGLIPKLQAALNEYPEFKPIVQADIKTPEALKSLQDYMLAEAGRNMDKSLAAAGLSGTGAGMRAKTAALEPLTLQMALQGYNEGLANVLREEQRKKDAAQGKITNLSEALRLLHGSGSTVPAQQASAVGQSAGNQDAINKTFGTAELQQLMDYAKGVGQAYTNTTKHLSDLAQAGGVNLANLQFQAGQNRANTITGVTNSMLGGVNNYLTLQALGSVLNRGTANAFA